MRDGELKYFIILQTWALCFAQQRKSGFEDVVLLAVMAKKISSQI